MRYLRQFIIDVYVRVQRHPFIAGCISVVIVQLLCVTVVGGLLTIAIQNTIIPMLSAPISLPIGLAIAILFLSIVIVGLPALAYGYKRGTKGKLMPNAELGDSIRKLESIAGDLREIEQAKYINAALIPIEKRIEDVIFSLFDPGGRTYYSQNMNMLLVECMLAFGVLSQDFKGNVHIIRPETPNSDSVVVWHSLHNENKKWRRIQLSASNGQPLGCIASMFKGVNTKPQVVKIKDADFDLVERTTQRVRARSESSHILHISLSCCDRCQAIMRIETSEMEDLNKIKENPSLPLIASRLGFLFYVEEKINANSR